MLGQCVGRESLALLGVKQPVGWIIRGMTPNISFQLPLELGINEHSASVSAFGLCWFKLDFVSYSTCDIDHILIPQAGDLAHSHT
jgi:hypothetical protein